MMSLDSNIFGSLIGSDRQDDESDCQDVEPNCQDNVDDSDEETVARTENSTSVTVNDKCFDSTINMI